MKEKYVLNRMHHLKHFHDLIAVKEKCKNEINEQSLWHKNNNLFMQVTRNSKMNVTVYMK